VLIRIGLETEYLNTPRLVADATGTTVWRWDQAEPFGTNAANDDPDGNLVAFDLPLRLPGQRYDAETALHYNYFRDYDPSIGRYTESDPIGLLGGLNVYVYADGHPIGLADPDGLAPGRGGRSSRQSCTPLVRSRLEFQVNVFCRTAQTRCEDCDECPVLDQKVHAKRSCMIAQRLLSKLCFPRDQTHKQRVTDMQKGIRRCMGIIATKGCNSVFGDDPDMLPPSLDMME